MTTTQIETRGRKVHAHGQALLSAVERCQRVWRRTGKRPARMLALTAACLRTVRVRDAYRVAYFVSVNLDNADAVLTAHLEACDECDDAYQFDRRTECETGYDLMLAVVKARKAVR